MTGSLRIEPLQYASIKNTPSKSGKDKLHGEIFNLADSHHVRLFTSQTLDCELIISSLTFLF
jgi:hypothetical protein